MHKHTAALMLIVGATAAVTACGDNLQIANLNNPDVARAYSTPVGVEGVVAGLGAQVFNTQRANESINTQAKILAAESYATVANFGMATRAQIPRSIISNELGNDNQTGNLANFNSLSRTSRTAANSILAIDNIIKSGSTIGSPARDARAKAFAFLALGQALGDLSLGYDSAAVVTPVVVAALPDAETFPSLSSAADVNKAAIAMLDSAVNIATSPAATNGADGFPLPPAWINGNPLTRDQFVQLVKSFRARFRAGVARTPAERAAVNWQAIIADATAGITTDLTVNIGSGTGWSATFDASQMYVDGGWHMMPMYYVGMADVSGAYDSWLATPVGSRRAFLVVTPDKRWPVGATREDQQAMGRTKALPPGVYFRNRPSGLDVKFSGPGESWYDHSRYGAVYLNAGKGPYTDMSATEVSMLAAEGYIRTGNVSAAISLINVSRTAHGLDAIPTSLSSAATPYSDASACVPRVPKAPSFTSTECGSVLEAMKYEKRMETAFTGYLVWFTDSRGWGDLLEGTVVEWPVPYQEMQARSQPFYNGDRRAPKGTYGF